MCNKQYDDIITFSQNEFYVIAGIKRGIEVGMLTSGDVVDIFIVKDHNYNNLFIGKLILANKMNKKNKAVTATEKDIYKILKRILNEDSSKLF